MAVGDTLGTWGPTAASPPAAGFATLDVRNGHVVLDFDAAADEAAIFSGLYPAHYGGGDLQVELLWAATSAISGAVQWNAAIEHTTSTDIDGDGFGAASTATATTAATSGVLTKSTLTITAANAGDPVAGAAFRIKVTRDADNAADTMSGDAELWSVHFREV
jgi:hypothetical protein